MFNGDLILAKWSSVYLQTTTNNIGKEIYENSEKDQGYKS
jgi:hypothetical protein